MRLKDKVAVITGGATGIGQAICELFAREGARIAVNYNESEEAAGKVVDSVRQLGAESVALKANVAVDSEIRALMQSAVERWGRLDILVNNAGWSKRTPHSQLEDLTDEIWDRTLNINLRGAFYCMRAAAPLLRKQPGASIVNIASSGFYIGEGSTIVYAASKAGLVSMTKSFARILAPGVRVNAIAPGLVKTKFAGWPPETFVKGAAKAPLGRLASTEEVAAAALYLAADATAMTGETLRLDSGFIALGGSY